MNTHYTYAARSKITQLDHFGDPGLDNSRGSDKKKQIMG